MLSGERRKEEIEKKKQKLNDLRKIREERKLNLLNETQTHTTYIKDKSEIENLVASLLGDFKKRDYPVLDTPQQEIEPIVTQVVQYKPELTTSEFVLIEIAQQQVVKYTKEIQTDEIHEETKAIDKKPDTLETSAIQPTVIESTVEIQTRPVSQVILTDEEKDKIITSDSFHSFINYSSKVIERVLDESTAYDYTIDYKSTTDSSKQYQENQSEIKLINTYYSQQWSSNRSITSLDWSYKHPELFLASYTQSSILANDPTGVIQVWNTHLQSHPEFIFHAQSEILCAKFSEFHPNLIIGGTYPGQILIWDTRANSSEILKSPLTTHAHTHPVFSIFHTGTLSSNQIVSVDTDGLVCEWQIDMLAKPIDSFKLLDSSGGEVSVTCASKGRDGKFLVGTEGGDLFKVNTSDRAGVKKGVECCFRGHEGIVMGVDWGSVDDGCDLAVSCGADWSAMLWNVKDDKNISQDRAPLLKLSGEDSIYDIKWSSKHPSVFAAVDGLGGLNFYNLNKDLEYPVSVTPVDEGRALNKLAWDKEGKKVATGSVSGAIYVYDVREFAHVSIDQSIELKKTVSSLL